MYANQIWSPLDLERSRTRPSTSAAYDSKPWTKAPRASSPAKIGDTPPFTYCQGAEWSVKPFSNGG